MGQASEDFSSLHSLLPQYPCSVQLIMRELLEPNLEVFHDVTWNDAAECICPNFWVHDCGGGDLRCSNRRICKRRQKWWTSKRHGRWQR
eukprot:10633276-Lingulodinium_polyedra.AAC.1